MTLRALVPVSTLASAKGRLAGVLTDVERRALALTTLATVLEAVRDAGGEAFVLTRDPLVAAEASARAAVIGEDPQAEGLNAQLERAVAQLDGRELLILHADLPLANGDAVRRLVEAAPPARSVTLVRSRDGGTNAMLLRPPGRFPLRYGPDSARQHEGEARRAGFRVAFADVPELSLDLDTPEDLRAFLALPGAERTPAGALLLRWRVLEREEIG